MIANLRDWMDDPDTAKEGRRVDLGDGRAIYVRRAGGVNRRWQYAYSRIISEERERLEAAGALGGGEMTPDALEAIDVCERRAYAEAIVVRWEGLCDEGGSEIVYTSDEAEALFAAAPDIYELVKEMANDREAYRLDADCKSA